MDSSTVMHCLEGIAIALLSYFLKQKDAKQDDHDDRIQQLELGQARMEVSQANQNQKLEKIEATLEKMDEKLDRVLSK